MFAVYGDQIDPPFLHFPHNPFAAAHKRFFVGKRDRLARFCGEQSVFQPRESARRDKRDITLLEQRFFFFAR